MQHPRFPRPAALLFLVLLLVPFAAFACGDDDDEPAGSPTPAQLRDVKVGYIPILIAAPLYIGIEKGYFEDEGINLQLERLAGGADMLVQTAAGNFNIGTGGIGAAAFNAAGAAIAEGRAVPFEIIAPLHYEKPPVTTPLVVSKARFDAGEITKVSDLKGKKVAINARGAATEYWLFRALEKGGLAFKDIELQAVPFQDVAAALQNKSIDASMLGEPFATLARDQGLVTILSEDFVNGDQPTAVYWNRNWANDNKELAEAFLRAYLKSVKFLEDGGWEDDATIAIIEQYTQVKADVIKRANRPYGEPSGTINVESFKNQERFFREQGLLTYQGELDFRKFMRLP